MWFHLSIAVSLKFPVFTVLFKQMKIITTQNLYCVLTTTNKNCGWIYADTDFSSSTIFAQLRQYFKRKLRNIYLQAGARERGAGMLSGRSRHGWICLMELNQFLLMKIIIGFKLINSINVDIEACVSYVAAAGSFNHHLNALQSSQRQSFLQRFY